MCAKVRDLDTFDGTEPKKLRTFLVQCKLVFTDRPKAFRQDWAKVTFVQSYLKGMALEWFELDLLDSADPNDCPCWMDSCSTAVGLEVAGLDSEFRLG